MALRPQLPNQRLLQSRQTSGSRATLTVTTLAAQQNRRDVRWRRLSAQRRPYMRDGVVVAALIVCVLSACNVPETPPDADHPLVGTWQLVEWRAQDSLGVWQEDFGTRPLGYFVYGASGHLSIHLMHEAGGAVSDCAPPSENNLVLPACYVGYFGTYRIEPGDSVVIHQPVGGTILSYIGTNQPRRFEVRGDSLWIQRSESVYRLLLRVD